VAISDWTSQVQGNYVFLLETISPIAGTGSLRLERNSGTGSEGAIIYPTSLTTGLTKGRLQTVLHLEEMTEDNAVNQYVGMFFMINSLSNPLTSSSMYSFMVGVNDLGAVSLNLGKSVGGGVAGLNVTSLDTSAIPAVPVGNDLALQVDWVYDAIQFAGVKITANWKQGDDFTSLINAFDLVDNISPLTTSVAEGLGGLSNTGPNDWVMFFDDTSLFDLVPV